MCPWGDFLPDLGVVGSVLQQAREPGWLGWGAPPARLWPEALKDLCCSGKPGEDGGLRLRDVVVCKETKREGSSKRELVKIKLLLGR